MRTPRFVRAGAAAMALGLALTACGGDADTTTDPADTGSEAEQPSGDDEPMAEAAGKACQVTDEGGVDDRSFNQTAYAGLQQAESELDAEIAFLESGDAADFEPNINTFLGQDCDIIITVGFALGDATLAAAEANPEQAFAIVDFDLFDFEAGADITLDNVKELTFSTDEAAFLAGYLAAGMTETGVLGTFGGIAFPTVTIFMNGFEAGMEKYNEVHGTDVVLKGWNSETQEGTFTGDFSDQDKGRATTESLIDEGADIILPVAGPVGLGAAAAAKDAGVKLIWVDTDGCVSAAEFCDIFLTSVMKNMDVAVFEAVKAKLDGSFAGGLYVGTLENDGVGIAPYHEFEDDVPAELKAEVEQLKADIISGAVTVS